MFSSASYGIDTLKHLEPQYVENDFLIRITLSFAGFECDTSIYNLNLFALFLCLFHE